LDSFTTLCTEEVRSKINKKRTQTDTMRHWYICANNRPNIFNLSLASGQFPNKLKTSKTVPIFMPGDKNRCDNYHPISLLNTIPKALEKLAAMTQANYLESNGILFGNHYDFMRNRSTVHNIIQ
jgi:hypothetical protein